MPITVDNNTVEQALTAWVQIYKRLNGQSAPDEETLRQASEVIGRIHSEGIQDPNIIAQQLGDSFQLEAARSDLAAQTFGRVGIPFAGKPISKLLQVLLAGEQGNRLSADASVSATRQGPSTLGTTLEIAYKVLLQKLGISDASPLRDRVAHGVDTIAHTTFVPDTEAPATIEDATQRYEDLNQQEIEETRAYESDQIGRMTAETAKKYLSARIQLVALYQSEKEGLDAWLKKAHEVGYPDPTRLQQAKKDFDQAVYDDASLQARGIGPAELQILLKKKAYEQALASQDKLRINFTRSKLLGQERMYVLETFAYRISQLYKAGGTEKDQHNYELWHASKKEAQRLEELGVKARELYDRLIDGKELLAGDYDLLAKVRAMAFPFELPQGEFSPGVRQAIENQKKELQAFDVQSKKFMTEMMPVSLAMNNRAEEIAMERDQIDFDFQIQRLQEEFNRLKTFVESKGEQLHPDDVASFEKNIQEYKDHFKKYKKYHEAFYRGVDIKARENGRNKFDKNLLFQLVFGSQWQLFELYKHYDVKDEGGNTVLPSCLSLAYSNTLRVFDKGYRSNTIIDNHVATYFRGLHAHLKDAYKELGLRVPNVDFKVGGRNLLDLAAIDNLAAEIASGATQGISDKIFIHGAEQLMYLAQEQPSHPDAFMVAGAERVFSGIDPHTRLDMSRNAIFFRSNHTGIREFWEALKQGWFGLHLPQQAQGGLKNVPIFGDYLYWRTVLVERDQGAADANRKILDFLRREMAILSYTSGTRMVSASGGNAYVDYDSNPSMVLARRIITDRFTAGQDAKILLDYAKESGGEEGVLVANVVHNTGLSLPEPTWFLSGGVAEMIMGNLDPETMLNFWDPSIPTHIKYGLVMSSLGYMGAKEWKKIVPQLFKHENGEDLSDKAADYKALQLNAAVMTAAMRFDAAQIDLEKQQPETEAQLARQEQLKNMSDDQAHGESIDPMSRHLEDRMSRIQKASQARVVDDSVPAPLTNPEDLRLAKILNGEFTVNEFDPVDERKKERVESILAVPHQDTTVALNTYLSESDATQELKRVFTVTDNPKVKTAAINAKALPYMIEAMQRGAKAAKTAGVVAFDLDKVMWDHFFPVSSEQFLGLTKQEIQHFLLSQNGVSPEMDSAASSHALAVSQFDISPELTEVININPLWLAFVIGYAKNNGGKAPVFFSSTMSARLIALVGQQDQSPLVKEFFRVMFPELNNDASKIKQALTPQGLLQDYREGKIRIVTREVIAAHIVALMDKYRAEHFSMSGFSEAEKVDIEAILRTDGDVHLKLRSLVPYDVLIDDRRENAQEAAKHKGVTVVNPEPHASGIGSLYWTTDLESHINQRLLQGRSGKALTAMRLLQSSEGKGRLISIPRKYKVSRVSGLFDANVKITYTRQAARTGYEAPIKAARDAALAAKLELKQTLAQNEIKRKEAKSRLTVYYQSLRADQTIPQGLLDMALCLVDITKMKKDDKGKYPEVKSDAEIQALLAPLRYVADSEEKKTAIEQIKFLEDRELATTVTAITPKEKKGLKAIGSYWSKIVKFVTKQLPEMGAALGSAGQHLMADIMAKELGFGQGTWQQLGGYLRTALKAGIRDAESLRMLALEMQDPKNKKMTPARRAEAYGLALQVVFNYLVKKHINQTDLSGHLLEDETEASLKDKLHKRREQMGKTLRDAVTNGGYAAHYASISIEHFKDLFNDFGALFRSPLGESAKSSVWNFLSGDVVGNIFQSLNSKIVASLASGSESQTHNTLIAQAVLSGLDELVSNFPALQSIIGYFDAVNEQKGFTGLVSEISRAASEMKKLAKPEIRDNGAAIAQKLVEGSWDAARGMAQGLAMVFFNRDASANKDEAKKHFELVFGAAHMVLAPQVEAGQIRIMDKEVEPVITLISPAHDEADGSVVDDPIAQLWAMHDDIASTIFVPGMVPTLNMLPIVH